jgi:hypothetical protein
MTKKDTYSYKGWLISDNFWKRAFAVTGHNMAAVGLIYAVLIVLFIIAMLLFAAISVLIQNA